MHSRAKISDARGDSLPGFRGLDRDRKYTRGLEYGNDRGLKGRKTGLFLAKTPVCLKTLLLSKLLTALNQDTEKFAEVAAAQYHPLSDCAVKAPKPKAEFRFCLKRCGASA